VGLAERLASPPGPLFPPHPLRPEALEALAGPLWPSLFASRDPGATGIAVEVRHPFFDLRLIRFLLSVPPAQWYNDKGLLVAAMRGRLPPAILRRPKAPLPDDPLAARRRAHGEGWLDGRTLGPEVEPWVDPARVPAIAGGRAPGPGDPLWLNVRPLELSLWLREHGAGPS
jgi:asparagine synthase (glutamine-hydrolysing)